MTSVECGYCGRQVQLILAEHCWYCGGRLCGECWEYIGHCGHQEAYRLDRQLVRRVMHRAEE